MDLSDSTLQVKNSLEFSEIEFPPIPKDVLYPDELNRYLRDQIRYYIHENSMLKKNVEYLEDQHRNCKLAVSELEKKLNEQKTVDQQKILPSSQVTSVKIVELSKKLRERNAEVESLKTKCSKLKYQLFKARSKDEFTEEEPVVDKTPTPTNELEEQIKKLQEKANTVQSKLSDANNTCLQLKNDLKLATKYLQQEIGDSFESLHTFTSNIGNWRGRAQIICDLQQRNNELREKLKNIQEKLGSSESNTSTKNTESKMSILSKENDEMKLKYEELKKKYDAAKARIKSLESDATLMKTRFSMLKQQTDRDQDIITTLSAQISNSKNIDNNTLVQKDRTINKLQNEKQKLLSQVEEYKSIVNGLRAELNAQPMKIGEEEKKDPEVNMCPQAHHISNDAIIHLKMEKEYLLGLLETQSERLKSEREAHAKTMSMMRAEKQKVTKAETFAALESTNNSRASSYSLSIAPRTMNNNIKDQLELAEENIKALKTRLEIEQYERKVDMEEFVKLIKTCQSKE